MGAAKDTAWVEYFVDEKGRAYVRGLGSNGLHNVRRELMAMGMERNLFEKWIKQSAVIAAREATKLAPVSTGRMAVGLRGMASKKYTVAGQTKRAWGGVIVSNAPYARRVSYGMRTVAGEKSIAGNRTWRRTMKTPGNAYMVKGREKAKPAIVHYWNNVITSWIKQKGF